MDGGCSGLPEILRHLNAVPGALQNKILTLALPAGARVIADEAARLVPVRTGNLRDTIRSRKAPRRFSRGNLTWHIAVGSRIAHLVEFGTAPHEIKPMGFASRFAMAVRAARAGARDAAHALMIRGRFVGGAVQHPGARPRPFLRPAFDRRADDALATIASRVTSALGKAEQYGIGRASWKGVRL